MTMKSARSKQRARLLAGMALAWPVPGVAESAHHSAHVHGVAELTVALEGRKLEIVFTSPAVSVVGFEHQAESQDEMEAVTEAKTKLSQASELFTFTGTQCDLQDSAVDVSAVLSGSAAERTAHSDHEAHTTEADSHDNAVMHSDISASYDYECAESGKLESIRVGSDGLPFGIEKINVMWVSDRGQGATELNAGKPTIDFE